MYESKLYERLLIQSFLTKYYYDIIVIILLARQQSIFLIGFPN